MREDIKHTHWVFDDNADDVRGWPVRDHKNALLGTVTEMYVDPETSYVTGIQLADGTKILAERIRIGDKELTVVAATTVATAAAAAAPAPAPEPAPAKPAPKMALVPEPPKASVEVEGDDVLVELVGEELEVGKRRYDAGGVHVETHVVSEPIARDVRVREERVSVARTKVDRELTAPDAETFFHDSSVEVTARSEVPVVRKQTHVVEEVVVKKAGLSRKETVRDTVRQMDVAVTETRADAPKGGAR